MLRLRRFVATSVLIATLGGCASVPEAPPRLARSTYACMRAVLQEKLPKDLPDTRAHCLAGGLIARYCSVTEAYFAGAGKEFQDLVGSGDAEWKDWSADRAGIDCARSAKNDADLASCCALRGY
jgi:hypothetical protein